MWNYKNCNDNLPYVSVPRWRRSFKTESIRKLSDFNFQWTKTLCQNNLNNTAFFFRFFKGYRYNLLSLIIPKTYFSWEPDKINVKFHKNCEKTGKILKISCVKCLWNLTIIFSGSHPSNVCWGLSVLVKRSSFKSVLNRPCHGFRRHFDE